MTTSPSTSHPPPTTTSSLIKTYISTIATLFPSLSLPTHPHSTRPLHTDPQSANKILSQILSGTITSRTIWPVHRDTLPEIGDITVLLDGNYIPAAIVRTKRVEIVPFLEVSWKFVREECGCAEASLKEWRRQKRETFSASSSSSRKSKWSDEEIVVCERFELVYPLACILQESPEKKDEEEEWTKWVKEY